MHSKCNILAFNFWHRNLKSIRKKWISKSSFSSENHWVSERPSSRSNDSLKCTCVSESDYCIWPQCFYSILVALKWILTMIKYTNFVFWNIACSLIIIIFAFDQDGPQHNTKGNAFSVKNCQELFVSAPLCEEGIL